MKKTMFGSQQQQKTQLSQHQILTNYFLHKWVRTRPNLEVQRVLVAHVFLSLNARLGAIIQEIDGTDQAQEAAEAKQRAIVGGLKKVVVFSFLFF